MVLKRNRNILSFLKFDFVSVELTRELMIVEVNAGGIRRKFQLDSVQFGSCEKNGNKFYFYSFDINLLQFR